MDVNNFFAAPARTPVCFPGREFTAGASGKAVLPRSLAPRPALLAGPSLADDSSHGRLAEPIFLRARLRFVQVDNGPRKGQIRRHRWRTRLCNRQPPPQYSQTVLGRAIPPAARRPHGRPHTTCTGQAAPPGDPPGRTAGQQMNQPGAGEKSGQGGAGKTRGNYGAQERTRTSTGLRPLDPESSASANSATWAPIKNFVWRVAVCQRTGHHRGSAIIRALPAGQREPLNSSRRGAAHEHEPDGPRVAAELDCHYGGLDHPARLPHPAEPARGGRDLSGSARPAQPRTAGHHATAGAAHPSNLDAGGALRPAADRLAGAVDLSGPDVRLSRTCGPASAQRRRAVFVDDAPLAVFAQPDQRGMAVEIGGLAVYDSNELPLIGGPGHIPVNTNKGVTAQNLSRLNPLALRRQCCRQRRPSLQHGLIEGTDGGDRVVVEGFELRPVAHLEGGQHRRDPLIDSLLFRHG